MKLRTVVLLAAALLLLAAPLVACRRQPEPPTPAPAPLPTSGGYTHFDNVSTGYLTVISEITTDALVASDAEVSDDLAVSDDASISGDLTVSGLAVLATSQITATTTTITPTVSAYHADSAGAVTWTLSACSTNGQLLLVYGDDNNTITIADSSLRSTDGNAVTVGQYDVVLFVCVDTEWVHVAKSANS